MGFGLLLGGLVLLALIAVLVASIMHPNYYPAMLPYYGGFLFFPFGFFFFIFIVFAAGRLLFWPWAWGWRRGYWYHRDEAMEILRQRYAKGEITKEQFAQMMRDLEQRN